MTDDYSLDADRIFASDSYGATIYQLSDTRRETEGPSLPFGFTPPKDLQPSHVKLPEPWMWWVQ